MHSLLLVGGAGLLAGTMNALVGGGSFVSLPALLAVGLPSVQANTTSTVALWPGAVVSAWTYRRGLRPIGPVSLRALTVVTVLGSAIGAWLLLNTPSSAFDRFLPWLLLTATLTLTLGRRLGEGLRRRVQLAPAAVLGIQFGLGVYGGYFGGAVGIMMMAVWRLLESRELKDMHAPRTLLVSAANGIAVLAFIVARAVRWREALVMLVGAVAGGYLGARAGQRASAVLVRAITLGLSVCITAAFFVKAYWP